MLIAIIGEHCSGKTFLAEKLREGTGAELMSGRDYLRMARSESEAVSLFRRKLESAVRGDDLIYVISEPEHLALLPDGAVRILVSADLDTIRERFRARMRGNLPEPVARMLERQHGIFDGVICDFRFDGVNGDPDALRGALEALR